MVPVDAPSLFGPPSNYTAPTSAHAYGDELSQQFTLPPAPLSSFTGLHLSSQLYLAAVVVDNATKAITTYPAVYAWNQNRWPGNPTMNHPSSNLTPGWAPIAPVLP
jgi:hypothetical protein